jgi:hypothetical protein
MNYIFWISVVVILGASIAIGLSFGLKKCNCTQSSSSIILKTAIGTDFMDCQSIEERPNKGNFTLKSFLETVFDGSLPGTVIYPDDALYGYAAEHYNLGLRQAFPGGVVFCRTQDDVIAAVKAACNWNIEVHIRCGRHDYGGFSSGGGMIIDVSRMKKVSINRTTNVVIAGAGLRLGDLYPYLAQYGLTVNGGTCPGVGLAGLLLGGGAGPFERKYGMLCDMMISAKIVIADGSLVYVDKDNNADLYWALKGGGAGNFGVVTEFEIQCFEVPSDGIDYHVSFTNWDQAADIIMAYQNTLVSLNIDTIWLRLFLSDVRSLSFTAHYWEGSRDSLESIIKPILDAGSHNIDSVLNYDASNFMDHINDWANNWGDLVDNVPIPGDQTLILANPFGTETKIQMQASNGKWLSCRENGQIMANGNSPSLWETFTVVAVPDAWNLQKIQLKAYTGKWVTAEGGGGEGLWANRDTPSGWETFTVSLPWHSYNIKLQASSGQWIGLNGDEITANKTENDSSVILELEHTDNTHSTRSSDDALGNRFKSLYGGTNPENDRTGAVMDRAGIEFFLNKLPTYPGPTWGGMMIIDSIGGQQGRITDNAYSHREALWITQLMANYDISDYEQTREVIEWMRELHDGIAQYAKKFNDIPLAYRNYADLDVNKSGVAYYEGNLQGLIDVKNKYDPNNFFTYSQAIKSTKAGTGIDPQTYTCYDVYGR